MATKNPPSADYKSGTVTPEFLKEVARLDRNAGKRIPRADSRRRGEVELEEVARWRQPYAALQQSQHSSLTRFIGRGKIRVRQRVRT